MWMLNTFFKFSKNLMKFPENLPIRHTNAHVLSDSPQLSLRDPKTGKKKTAPRRKWSDVFLLYPYEIRRQHHDRTAYISICERIAPRTQRMSGQFFQAISAATAPPTSP